MASEVTVETLSCLPRGYNSLDAGIASSTDGDFHERQVKRAQGEEYLNAKHVSAITVSVQQCSDIIGRDHVRISPQAEMLVGLQMHLKADPPAGIPADLRADLEPGYRPDSPASSAILIDDQLDDAPLIDHIEGAYATAYQLRPQGTARLASGVAETMRREAAMDDAIFRPNLRLTRKMGPERRWDGEHVGTVASVRRNVRKRKRETKDTD